MTPKPKGTLDGRVALIAGASRGLGAAIGKALARAGAQVILVARTQAALEAVDDAIQAETGHPASLLPLDLRAADKVEQMALAIAARFGRLDILVGVAGILGGLSPHGHHDPATVRDVIETNYLVHWQVLRAVDPMLRRSDAGRVIMVTAEQAAGGHAFWGPYAASKAALEAMLRCYAAETQNSALRANLFDPGPLATGLRRQAFPGEPAEKLGSPDAAAEHLVALASPAEQRHGALVRAPAEAPDFRHLGPTRA